MGDKLPHQKLANPNSKINLDEVWVYPAPKSEQGHEGQYYLVLRESRPVLRDGDVVPADQYYVFREYPEVFQRKLVEALRRTVPSLEGSYHAIELRRRLEELSDLLKGDPSS